MALKILYHSFPKKSRGNLIFFYKNIYPKKIKKIFKKTIDKITIISYYNSVKREVIKLWKLKHLKQLKFN